MEELIFLIDIPLFLFYETWHLVLDTWYELLSNQLVYCVSPMTHRWTTKYICISLSCMLSWQLNKEKNLSRNGFIAVKYLKHVYTFYVYQTCKFVFIFFSKMIANLMMEWASRQGPDFNIQYMYSVSIYDEVLFMTS